MGRLNTDYLFTISRLLVCFTVSACYQFGHVLDTPNYPVRACAAEG